MWRFRAKQFERAPTSHIPDMARVRTKGAGHQNSAGSAKERRRRLVIADAQYVLLHILARITCASNRKRPSLYQLAFFLPDGGVVLSHRPQLVTSPFFYTWRHRKRPHPGRRRRRCALEGREFLLESSETLFGRGTTDDIVAFQSQLQGGGSPNLRRQRTTERSVGTVSQNRKEVLKSNPP